MGPHIDLTVLPSGATLYFYNFLINIFRPKALPFIRTGPTVT